MSRFTHALRSVDDRLFRAPYLVLALILIVTLFFASRIPGLKMYSDFADLLPQEHPYIQLHNEIRDTFGGANVVIIGITVEDGTIFTNETLGLIHRLTQAVHTLPGINHNLVSSLTHRTARKVWLTELGDINSEPYFDPLKAGYTEQELAQMRDDVLANPRMYGLLVSPDLKSALIKGTLNEGALDYVATFEQLQALRAAEALPGVEIYATGQPALVGWVYSYLGQIIQIFFYTVLIMLALLVLYFRRFYGILLPLIGITVTAIWGLGAISLLGFNLDPLTLVIPFLISARALSHGIQLVERYYHELPGAKDGADAARRTFDSLFRPGSLGVISDAIGIFLISLGSIPLNTKLAYYGALWSLGVIVTVLIAVPLILTILPTPKSTPPRHSFLHKALPLFGAFVAKRGTATAVLVVAAGLYVVGASLSSQVQIGEAEPGSPLLYPDHDYNVSSKAINQSFPGSEELYVIARTDAPGGLKRPEVLHALEDFQIHMLYDPELGGAKGLPDLVKQVNRLMHNDDPRWAQIPKDPSYVGGLLFTYMASSPIPGALKEFLNPEETDANMVFYFKDHQGGTIRRATHRLKEWIDNPENHVEGLSFHLAGGIIGVTAASNEAAYETNMLVVPLVLALIFLFVTLFYWSLHAGWLMLLAMSFATILSYAYMGVMGIGINVNTVPIIAVGIGVGIDYSIYIMDRIREEMAEFHDLGRAVHKALATTGLAICFTATTLVAGVIMWVFVSDLRFQADAALLLCVMLVLNAIAALVLVPSWIVAFKPRFITQVVADEEGVLVTA